MSTAKTSAKKRPIKRDQCGTYPGYSIHVYHGEYACEPCRLARCEYARFQGRAQSYALRHIRDAHRDEYENLLKALDPKYGPKWRRAMGILRDEYVEEYLEYLAAYKAAHS